MAGTELRAPESPSGVATEATVPTETAPGADVALIDRIHNVHLEVEKLRTEVVTMRDELRSEMVAMRDELRSEMVAMRDELRSEMRDEARELKRGMHRWLAFGVSFLALLIVLMGLLG